MHETHTCEEALSKMERWIAVRGEGAGVGGGGVQEGGLRDGACPAAAPGDHTV
jgi:hypothetical protein